jgi:hypothetical protein
MTKADPPLDGKKLAQDIHLFLEDELGKHLIKQLSYKYNELHQAAESEDLTIEQKALKVERAAGLKWALDYLLTRNQRFVEGYWEDPDAEKS